MVQDPPTPSLYQFKEVCVDVKPEAFNSVIQFRVPSSSIIPSRHSHPKWYIAKSPPIFRTDEEFTRWNSASESSIYFGGSGYYPRNFLWRVVDGGRALRIQSVDLSKRSREKGQARTIHKENNVTGSPDRELEREQGDREASLVLQFHFPGPLRRGGVAFADAEDHESLSLFVLSTSNELYTLVLKRSFFCSASASQVDIGGWCNIYKPASLNFTTPHSFLARSALELVIGLSDGRLVRLTRRTGENGAAWHEVAYNDGKWGSSLRSLVRWQGTNTIPFDGTTLEKNTAQAIVPSPDQKHLWVVCLDHTLKVWNIEQGKTVYVNDLLGVAREPQDTPKYLLDPHNHNLIQIVHVDETFEGDHYYVMTYSPHDLGQFKVWGVRNADAGDRGIRDLYPDDALRPPDPDPSPESKAIWKVVDFKTKVAKDGHFKIWLLMKSQRYHKLYHLNLPIEDIGRSLSSLWKHSWTTTMTEILTTDPPPDISNADAEGAMESWAAFVLDSARYPAHVVETALQSYITTRKLAISLNHKSSLRTQVSLAISSSVRLQRRGSDEMDFDGYRLALEQEWATLWQEIRDLDNSRYDVLSLAYDDDADSPWLVFTDACSIIRNCGKTEILAHNDADILKSTQSLLPTPSIENGRVPILPDELSALVAAAATLRQSFNDRLRRTCKTVLATELWQDPSYSVPTRIEDFYQRCDFENELDDDAFSRAESKLPRNMESLGELQTAHFEDIIRDLPRSILTNDSSLRFTSFGLSVIARGAAEIIKVHERILTDLLVLLVIVQEEYNVPENPMRDFDSATLFVELSRLLKETQLMQWTVQTTRLEPSSDQLGIRTAKPSGETLPRKSLSILEGVFAQDVRARSCEDQSQSEALLQDIQDVLVYVVGGNGQPLTLDPPIESIQCNLLKHGNVDLATDFLRYMPSTAWAIYLKGRLHLLRGKYTEAAIAFKRAAFKLSLPTDLDYAVASHNLLSRTEASYLGDGLSAYYTHIQTLFQASHSHSHVADFARLILQFTPDPSQRISPLTTLFHASIATSAFPAAFSALTRLPPATAADLIPTFLTALLAQEAFHQALSLPWPPSLQAPIDAFLTSKAASPSTSTATTVPHYHKLLAAWRLHHHDPRGAAAALLNHLPRIRKPPSSSSFAKAAPSSLNHGTNDDDNDEVLATYLHVINLLACMGGEQDAWVLSDACFAGGGGKRQKQSKEGGGGKRGKRKLVTIKDVRAAYQAELDRRSVLESGRWGFGLDGTGEEMDLDGEGEEGE